MYEVNGICYAGRCEEGIRISDVKLLQGNLFLVTFNTGESRIFDPLQLKGSAFEPLQNEETMKDYALFHGILTWCDGEIDIAPETVYAESVKYERAM